MKVYKLTDGKMQTLNGTQWTLGKETTVDWKERKRYLNDDIWGMPRTPRLCTPCFLHAYSHPLLAFYYHVEHVSYERIRLFECETRGQKLVQKDKIGFTRITPKKELKWPYVNKLKKFKSFVPWAATYMIPHSDTKSLLSLLLESWERAFGKPFNINDLALPARKGKK